MKNTRNRTNEANSTVPGTCFVCNTNHTTGVGICKNCTKRLNAICNEKDDESDKLLADAIKKNRTKDRRILVTQRVRNLCKSCSEAKEKCKSLMKANKRVKDELRNFKLAQESKMRNGFKVKTENQFGQRNSNLNLAAI